MAVRPFLQFGLFLVFSFCILTWEVLATAGTLKMETQTTVEVAKDLLTANVTLTNRGTAPAYNLQVHLNILGEEQNSPIKPQLDPGQSDKVLLERDLAGTRKGRYPLTIRVDFHDANQYPFSALSGMTFHIREDVNPNLVALAEDMTMEKTGNLKFHIKNLGFKSKKILASLAIPKEFSTPKATINLQIDPRSEKIVDFEINNFSALPGASYPVFCYLEYDSDDIHHTAVARALLRIAEEKNLFRRSRWVWIVLTLILSLILITLIVRERKKRIRA